MMTKDFIEHRKLSKKTCETLIAKIDTLINQEIVSQKTDDDTRIFGFEKFISNELSRKLFEIDQKAAQQLKSRTPHYQSLMANKTVHHPYGKGSGAGWHRDSYIKPQIKTIFYLNKVTNKNGPFELLIPKLSFFGRYIPIGTRISDDHVSNFSKFYDSRKFNADVQGLGFSANTNLVHRGNPVIEGERYAITVYSWFSDPPEHILNMIQKMENKCIEM